MASTKSTIQPNVSGYSSFMVNMVDLLKDWKFQPQVLECKKRAIPHVQTEGARAQQVGLSILKSQTWAVEKQNRHYKPYGFDLKEGTSRILLGKTHFVVKVCKSM